MADLLSKSQLKSEYGLTDKLIGMLGAPDVLKPNPHYRKAAPMAFYDRRRVTAFMASNSELIAVTRKRKASAGVAVETKRQQAAADLEMQLQALALNPIPPMNELTLMVARFISDRYGEAPDVVTPKAICSYIRHNYTNYEAILSSIRGKVGTGELYQRTKREIVQRIIDHYALPLSVDDALKL